MTPVCVAIEVGGSSSFDSGIVDRGPDFLRITLKGPLTEESGCLATLGKDRESRTVGKRGLDGSKMIDID